MQKPLKIWEVDNLDGNYSKQKIIALVIIFLENK